MISWLCVSQSNQLFFRENRSQCGVWVECITRRSTVNPLLLHSDLFGICCTTCSYCFAAIHQIQSVTQRVVRSVCDSIPSSPLRTQTNAVTDATESSRPTKKLYYSRRKAVTRIYFRGCWGTTQHSMYGRSPKGR